MLCPKCNEELLLKSKEPYKEFFLCSNIDCEAVSIIITTTKKYSDYVQDGGLNSK